MSSRWDSGKYRVASLRGEGRKSGVAFYGLLLGNRFTLNTYTEVSGYSCFVSFAIFMMFVFLREADVLPNLKEPLCHI